MLIYLDFFLYFVLGLILLTWLGIFYSYIYRKQRLRKDVLIETTFAELMGRFLYGDLTGELDFLKVQRRFRKIGITEGHPRNIQKLIELMVKSQRALTGEQYEKLRDLYNKIPPYKASYKKTLKSDWYTRAQGIREIYEMNQRQYTRHLAQFRNHPNLFVRREAQIGLVIFLGWDSLRFLPYLDREMELWQQIKIVEKLHKLYPTPRLEYIRTAHTIKSPSGRELLIRIIRKFEIMEGVDFVISQISDPVFYVREAAIKALATLKLNDLQISRVQVLFSKLENLRLQKQVLSIIAASTEEVEPEFFLNLLESEKKLLRLKAAEVLWTKGYQREVRKISI